MTAFASSLTFDEINRNAQPYPAFMLPKGGSALALFAAGFHGWNDVVHMARKEMSVTCVDTDADKLWEMAQIYPAGWEWRVEDAWEFAEHHAREGIKYDVVSVDPYMGNIEERAREALSLWCALAETLVTFTVAIAQPLWAPPGWSAEIFPRNEKVGWMMLRRA